MTNKKTKSRFFTFLIYPDSIPEDWEDCLVKLGVSMAVSPLHNSDEKESKNLSPEEENIVSNGGKVYKKAHYHVLYIARNPVTADSVRNKIKRALGNNALSHVEVVDNVENVYLYLTHESADAIKKNKHKYDKKDIVFINGFDIERYVTLDESEKRELFNLLLGLIHKFKIENIIDLTNFVELNGEDYGLPCMNQINDVIAGKTGLLKLYFDGNYQIRKRNEESDSKKR